MQDRTLGILGIAKKAGKLALGSEATAIASRQGKARLIITASDASAGTVRRAAANAKLGDAELLKVPYTKFELGNITGRGSPGVISFLDKGLANSFKEKLKTAGYPVTAAEKPAKATKRPTIAEEGGA